MMHNNFFGITKTATRLHPGQMLVFIPAFEAITDPALFPQLLDLCNTRSERSLGFPLWGGWRPIVIIRRKDATRLQNPFAFLKGRLWLHPMQRLRTSDDLGAVRRQLSLV